MVKYKKMCLFLFLGNVLWSAREKRWILSKNYLQMFQGSGEGKANNGKQRW